MTHGRLHLVSRLTTLSHCFKDPSRLDFLSQRIKMICRSFTGLSMESSTLAGLTRGVFLKLRRILSSPQHHRDENEVQQVFGYPAEKKIKPRLVRRHTISQGERHTVTVVW
jgi:hypothetical protein